MIAKNALYAILVLAFAGILFSGYLTYYTLFTGNPGCELFMLGLPSCLYGLLMYAAVLLLSIVVIFSKLRSKAVFAITILSIAGIAFAGFLTLYVLSNRSCTSLDIFGIPPCVYGLIMYIVIFALALLKSRK